jgi:hypothetical protein
VSRIAKHLHCDCADIAFVARNQYLHKDPYQNEI